MKKEHDLIMLPTDRIVEDRMYYYKYGLSLFESKHFNGRKILSLERSSNGTQIPNPQHLYITSSEEIKEGDWCINIKLDPTKSRPFIKDFKYDSQDVWYRKIIATTDPDLKVYAGYDEDISGMGIYISLSQIPQSFTEEFISEYNKGNIITKVMVEYDLFWNNSKFKEQPFPDEFATEKDRIYKLKINKDNTISISRNDKQSWTREEVIELMEKSINRGIQLKTDLVVIHKRTHIDLWIKENI